MTAFVRVIIRVEMSESERKRRSLIWRQRSGAWNLSKRPCKAPQRPAPAVARFETAQSYAGLLSSVGLGFLISAAYLLPLAIASHEVVTHDMQRCEAASKAKQYGVRSVPAIVIDGRLARCCAGRGPDEHILRSALA
jgi:glutaredoxin 3